MSDLSNFSHFIFLVMMIIISIFAVNSWGLRPLNVPDNSLPWKVTDQGRYCGAAEQHLAGPKGPAPPHDLKRQIQCCHIR